MGTFKEIITKLNEDYRAAVAAGRGESFSKLSTIFEELGKDMREYIQEESRPQVEEIIKRLKKNQPLSDADKKMIRLWIVGDAESYTLMENNYSDWLKELERLMFEISKFGKERLDVTEASRLQALFRDGARLLVNIFYYLEQKDRVHQFEETTREIDEQERQLLIRLLEQKKQSAVY